MGAAVEAGEGKETDSLLEPPGGMQPREPGLTSCFPSSPRFPPSWPLVPPSPRPESQLQELGASNPADKVHLKRCCSRQFGLRFAASFLNPEWQQALWVCGGAGVAAVS